MAVDDHYAVLGVVSDAPLSDIRRAFHRLALSYHPDKNPDGERLFKGISTAYDVLCDESSRAAYDAQRRAARKPAGRPHPPFTGTRPFERPFSDRSAAASSPVRRARAAAAAAAAADATACGVPTDDQATDAEEDAAAEEAAAYRRREPISAYQFRGREKRLFEEVLRRDEAVARKKAAMGGDTGDFHKWRRRMEEEKAAFAREAAERVLERERAAAAQRSRDDAERAEREARVKEETRKEWEREVRRLDEERRQDAVLRTQKERLAAKRAAAEAESRVAAAAVAAAASAALRADRRRKSLDDVARLPGIGDIALLGDADVERLERLLTQCLRDVSRERRSREALHGFSADVLGLE